MHARLALFHEQTYDRLASNVAEAECFELGVCWQDGRFEGKYIPLLTDLDDRDHLVFAIIHI